MSNSTKQKVFEVTTEHGFGANLADRIQTDAPRCHSARSESTPKNAKTRVIVRVRHNMAKTPTYNTWQAMRRRCYEPQFFGFANYGGKGIRVCESWLTSFTAFLADMGIKPVGASIDRIDGAGDYEPSNCRWASRTVQARNRSSFVKLTPSKVVQIRWLHRSGMTSRDIARLFGLRSQSMVTFIMNGSNWADVPDSLGHEWSR